MKENVARFVQIKNIYNNILQDMTSKYFTRYVIMAKTLLASNNNNNNNF